MALLEQWWPPMVDHAEQSRLWWSPRRHRVLAAGRGSGKSENAGRILLGGDEHHMGAICPPNVAAPLYIIAAPTRDQVKSIWWERIKGIVPKELMRGEPLETELTIRLVTGATIKLVGLDKPHRVEGVAIDGLIVDEFAEVKANSWESSLEPALNRRGRPGWAMFIGRPKGRGNFYDLWRKAKTADEWDSFHWTSEPVLGKEALDKIAETCDPLTFRQEYLADWVTFDGLAYYQWDPNVHLRRLSYNPTLPLVFALDFNVDPGVAAVMQEQLIGEEMTTCVIGEVHIPRNSNTLAVARKLVADYGQHTGEVHVYGDPAGGARHTSQTEGSDWELVKSVLRPVFGDRLRMRVPKSAPFVRDRINTFNTRLKTTTGVVRFAVDQDKAPNVVRDIEGVTLLAGGSGEIDKRGCEAQGLTHLTDAIGYYLHERHPIQTRKALVY
jgi:hypothetical protein